jgi:hypothetical protein
VFVIGMFVDEKTFQFMNFRQVLDQMIANSDNPFGKPTDDKAQALKRQESAHNFSSVHRHLLFCIRHDFDDIAKKSHRDIMQTLKVRETRVDAVVLWKSVCGAW